VDSSPLRVVLQQFLFSAQPIFDVKAVLPSTCFKQSEGQL
jgi:hypothetical protein